MAKSAPKTLANVRVEDLPEPPSLEAYFDAKKKVLAFEIREYLFRRNFIALEDALFEYGDFLERYPEAEPEPDAG